MKRKWENGTRECETDLFCVAKFVDWVFGKEKGWRHVR